MAASVASLSLSCFFELAELEEGGGIGGAGSGGSLVSGAGGDLPMGGSGNAGASGTVSVEPCPPGQKDCGDGACVPFSRDNGCGDPTCTPCAALPQAEVTCNGDTNLCQFAACNAGFADCDADTAAYPAEVGTGCEYAFGPGGVIRAPPIVLEAPLAPITIGDGSRDDWASVPAYPLVATCDNCVDDTLPDVIAKNELPLRSDLDAYFRVAWDQNFFYVLADVFDSSLVSNGADSDDGRCQNGALCEDAITVFFDGRNDRAANPGYGFDDWRVFVGLGGKAFRVSGSLVPGQVDLRANVHGPACYRIEAQFAWTLIVGVQPNASGPAGQFPPAPNQQYGFDISVNDWDPGVSDQTPQRESQLFWVSPGDAYQRVTTGFGPVRLTEAVAPAESPPQ